MTELADDGETILVPGEKSRNTEEVEAESISYGVLTATAIWPSTVIPVWSICFSARPAKPTRRSGRKPLSGIC